jgi:hypothetical protein
MYPSETTPPRLRAAAAPILATLAALAAGGALAACGGSGGAANAAASERAKEHQDEVKAANFAKCMREHGVDMTASSSSGGFQLSVRPGPGETPQKAEAAQKACQKYMPEPKSVKLSPQEKVKREEEVRKFAKCMREHGVDIHVEVGGGKVAVGIHSSAGSAGPNPASPAFQSAQKACSGYLPFRMKGGPGPAGPPPAGAHGEGPSTGRSGSSGFSVGG